MNKPKLILPNGLELSVGDRTNVGIVSYFTSDNVFTKENRYKHDLSEITSVQYRYDWTNALGEVDFAYEGDICYYNMAMNIESVVIVVKVSENANMFSKQSDAERYLESLKPKGEEKRCCNNCKIFNNCPNDIKCIDQSCWQPKEEKKDILDTSDFIEKPYDVDHQRRIMIRFAKEACKRQREICVQPYGDSDFEKERDAILNAPEPKME